MSPAAVRIIPFAVYMAFIALAELAAFLPEETFSPDFFDTLYPLRAGLTGLLLWFFRKHYTEIRWNELADARVTPVTIAVGVLLCGAWVNMDWAFAIQGELTPYDPGTTGTAMVLMLTARVAGAVLVVPVMEELFWRSFLARYLVNRDFPKVRPGAITMVAVVATSVLFGLEHNLWLAGILAGLVFTFIYMRTGSLAQTILCHAITNGALAAYVLGTGDWRFW
jgi:hypothetical protein